VVRARLRELAALIVAAALVASTVAPALVTASRPAVADAIPGATAAPVMAIALGTAVASATPGIAAGPAQPPDPTASAGPAGSPADAAGPPSACAPAPSGLTAAPVLSHGSRSRKVVALTFDDGYNPTNTLRILDVLRRYRVNATFFVTGRAVELFPAVWREVAGDGFPIGDHTYDHHDLTRLCFAAQLRELTRQAAVLREALETGPIALMRPPYGARDRLTTLAATAAGDEAIVTWDVDTRDWSGISAAAIARRALAGGKGSIVLMHTLYRTTASALPSIIAGYRARGFTFVTVGELLGVPGPVPFG